MTSRTSSFSTARHPRRHRRPRVPPELDDWEVLHLEGGDGLVFPALTAGPPDGVPVLFLHGFPQRPEAWVPTMELVGAAGVRGVAPAQRGYAPGARPHDTSAYALDHLVGDVLAMADALEWPTFSVVGHDWGGAVAWALAAAHPDRIRSLGVLSMPHPAAPVRALAGTQAVRSLYAGFFQLPIAPELVFGAAHGAALRWTLRRSGLPAAGVDEYVDALASRPALGAALAWYRATSLPTFAAVGDVAVPTLYVWSDGDTALGPTAARATADHVTGPYRFETIQGASHWLPETCPKLVAALLTDLLIDSATG